MAMTATLAARAITEKKNVLKNFEEEQLLFLSSIGTHLPNKFSRRLGEGIVDINKSAVMPDGSDLDPALIRAIRFQNKFAFDKLMTLPNINLQVTCSIGCPAALYAVSQGNLDMARVFFDTPVERGGVSINDVWFNGSPSERILTTMKGYSLVNYGEWPAEIQVAVRQWYNQEGPFKVQPGNKSVDFPPQAETLRVKYSGNILMLAYVFSKGCFVDTLDAEALRPYDIAMNPFDHCQKYRGLFRGDNRDDVPEVLEVNRKQNTIVFKVNMKNRNGTSVLPVIVEYDFTKVQALFKAQKAKLDASESKQQNAARLKRIEADVKAAKERAIREALSQKSAQKMVEAENAVLKARLASAERTVEEVKRSAEASAAAAEKLRAHIERHDKVIARHEAAIDSIRMEIQPLVQDNKQKAEVDAMRLNPAKRQFHTQMHVAVAAFVKACEVLSTDLIQRNETQISDYVAKGFKLLGDAMPVGGFIAKGIAAVITVITDKLELDEKRRMALTISAYGDVVSKSIAFYLTKRLQNALQLITDVKEIEKLTGLAIELVGKTLMSKDFYHKATDPTIYRTTDQQEAFIVETLTHAVERSPSFQTLLNEKVEKSLEVRVKVMQKQPVLNAFFTETLQRLSSIHRLLKSGIENPKSEKETLEALTQLLPNFPENPGLPAYLKAFISHSDANRINGLFPCCLKSAALSLTEKLQAQLLSLKPEKSKEKAVALSAGYFTGVIMMVRPGVTTIEASVNEEVLKLSQPKLSAASVKPAAVAPAPRPASTTAPTPVARPASAAVVRPALVSPVQMPVPAAASKPAPMSAAPAPVLHGYPPSLVGNGAGATAATEAKSKTDLKALIG